MLPERGGKGVPDGAYKGCNVNPLLDLMNFSFLCFFFAKLLLYLLFLYDYYYFF